MAKQTPRPFSLDGLEGWTLDAERPDAPVVVVVHGSLDRSSTFIRSARRVDGATVVAYDRRGYGSSQRLSGSHGVEGGVADLLEVMDAVGSRVAVGHSFGGVIALAAAQQHPSRFDAVAAFEPPQPWRRPPGEAPAPEPPPADVDPAAEAERFYRHIVGESAWDRLGEREREQLRRDGVALVDDIRGVRSERWLEGAPPVAPVAIGYGARSAERFRYYATELARDWDVALLEEAERATHGAHLSAPDAFAHFISQTVTLTKEVHVA